MDKSEFIELLEKSIVAQISNAEKSYFLSKKISENADAINHAANGRYKNLFGYLQMVLQRDVILSVSKIYDNPSKKYPTLCFESLLNEMKKNADKFPVVEENGHLQQELMRSEMPREEIYELLAEKDTPAFAANKVASFFFRQVKVG